MRKKRGSLTLAITDTASLSESQAAAFFSHISSLKREPRSKHCRVNTTKSFLVLGKITYILSHVALKNFLMIVRLLICHVKDQGSRKEG